MLAKPLFARANRAPSAEQRAAIFRALCDQLIPSSGSNMGMVALGLDKKLAFILQRSTAGSEAYRKVTEGFGTPFLALSHEQQQGQIEAALAGGPLAESLTTVLRYSAHIYYSHPQSWKSFNYKKPQPGGYPDYASHCVNDRV